MAAGSTEAPVEVSSSAAPSRAKLEAHDVQALCRASEQIRAAPGLALEPEFGFFKELILALGGALEPLPAPKAAPKAKEVTSVKEAPARPPPAPVEVLLEDSDEEMEVSGAMAEMQLPPNLISEEFADEPLTGGEKLEDSDRLPKDSGPFPALPPRKVEEPSDARKRVLAKVKQQAQDLHLDGHADKALQKYTELIRTGGASALVLAARAALLLKLDRPCASIRDACAAVQLNPDCGKAYHVRGAAHQKLGHFRKAHRDLSQGQKLDFSEESVGMHAFCAKKAGLQQDTKTGRWYDPNKEGAQKAVELLMRAEGQAQEPKKKPLAPPTKQLRPGQAVKLGGLKAAAHLNGRRALVMRLSPDKEDRWEVEIRLDRGIVEVKAIRSENIIEIRANQGAEWQMQERLFAEERKKREKEEVRWKEEEERLKRMEGLRKDSLRAEGMPDMDPSEKLEAEMSMLPLDHEAMSLLRRLRPKEALECLQQVGVQGISANVSSYIKIKVKQKLGEPDSEDEKPQKMPTPVPARAPPPMQPPSAPPPAPAPPAPAPAAAQAPSAPIEEPEDDSEDSDDEDFDLLPEDAEPLLDSGFNEPEPSEKQEEALSKWKQEAAEALESGDARTALDRYTEAIQGGGASALMLAKRGELLLKQKRPLAAIKDCSAALALNEDMGKAYRIRGIANRKLGRYADAKKDLVLAQKLDFDEGISAIEKFVTEKVRLAEKKESKKRRRTGDAGGTPDAKRAKDS